jgi:hypothetical protein
VAGAPLAVCAVTDPHALAGVSWHEVMTQSTPWFAESPVTAAAAVVVVPVSTVAAGCWVTEMPISATMLRVAVAVAVELAVDVAVMVTVPPVGTALGAMYAVAEPLAVWAGSNLPHAPAEPQLTVQSTPAIDGSFDTVAESATLACVVAEPGGVVVKATVTLLGGGMIVTMALAEALALVAEVAVTVTVPLGTLAGAV